MAVTLLRWNKVLITRDTLRPPFFSQCYVAALFAFVLMLGLDFYSMPSGEGTAAGAVTATVAVVWYAQAQVRWFMQDLGICAIRASATFLGAFLLAMTAALAVAVLINLDAKSIASAT